MEEETYRRAIWWLRLKWSTHPAVVRAKAGSSPVSHPMRKARKLDFGNEPEPEDQDTSWCPDHWSGVWQMDRYLRVDGLQVDGDILFDHTLKELDQMFPMGDGYENKILVMSCTDYQECGIVVLDSTRPIKKEVKMGSKQGCYIVRSN